MPKRTKNVPEEYTDYERTLAQMIGMPIYPTPQSAEAHPRAGTDQNGNGKCVRDSRQVQSP